MSDSPHSSASPPTAPIESTQEPTVIMWFRHDLRLDDNPTLNAASKYASQHSSRFCAVWFFEPRWSQRDPFGTQRLGARRARFLLESALELADALSQLGSELLIIEGDPVEELPKLATQLSANMVFATHHVAHEETEQQQAVAQALHKANRSALGLVWAHTLLRKRQLPWSLSDLPEVFTRFRKRVERDVSIDPPLASPTRLPEPPSVLSRPEHPLSLKRESALKSLHAQWGEAPESDPRAVMDFKGGERAAKARLNHYLWESRLIETYKETRNGLIGEGYSTKLSPWLNVGALSPRRAWAETLRYERERVENDSTYWVRFELLWREYFQWVALCFGADLFKKGGLSAALQRPIRVRGVSKGSAPQRRFEKWRRGQTGDDFVDANMRELNATGWVSNRGRQNVASYLIHDLGLDWRMGAGYFERALLDYDPASNWGNWAYIAGVGNDPRPQRKFNTQGQASRYDGEGAYRDLWLRDGVSNEGAGS